MQTSLGIFNFWKPDKIEPPVHVSLGLDGILGARFGVLEQAARRRDADRQHLRKEGRGADCEPVPAHAEVHLRGSEAR